MWGTMKCYILESFIFGFWETQTCCMHPIIALFPCLVFMIATNPGYIFLKLGFSHYEVWSSVDWVQSWQTWSPHFFAITFKNFCFFEGVENSLTWSGVSSLPLLLCGQLILLSLKEKSTDLMANSLLVDKIFHVEKSGLSSSPGVDFDLYNSIFV